MIGDDRFDELQSKGLRKTGEAQIFWSLVLGKKAQVMKYLSYVSARFQLKVHATHSIRVEGCGPQLDFAISSRSLADEWLIGTVLCAG